MDFRVRTNYKVHAKELAYFKKCQNTNITKKSTDNTITRCFSESKNKLSVLCESSRKSNFDGSIFSSVSSIKEVSMKYVNENYKNGLKLE